jgi:hypothetical protein
MEQATAELAYEGYVKYADGSVVSIQCFEGRCAACPDQVPDGDSPARTRSAAHGSLDGYDCEHGCGHGPAGERKSGEAKLEDSAALARIAEMLRDPEWGVGMLEDIADAIRQTGRTIEDYPDGRSTWGRH